MKNYRYLNIFLNLKSLSMMKQSYIVFLFIYLIINFVLNCSLNPPPITFTQTATAAEKQMLGEDRDIEADGWILSSIKMSASGSEIWQRVELDRDADYPDYDSDLYIALRKIAYFSAEVINWKKKRFVGESYSGELKINPKYIDSLYYQEFPNHEKRILEVLPQVNKTRNYINQEKIKELEKNSKLTQIQKDKLIQSFQFKYYNMVEKGEYFEESIGNWKIKTESFVDN
ncbi:DUF1318 domain-containing protein [Leptospira sp. GIMC2001]|uniref:DUF1318 domain-containing protein n=1 Tax=Leptospira sp. GIMC2001 TaxID=1513297 RepID=UPI00234A1233|nr:DUF1318 domain-containing protein [Leptospira sp. GIMC2001]WCL49730.1 DUF1318 domain-containing protein [Leptospira sp. GIMC2001]